MGAGSNLLLALATCAGLFAGGAYWHNAAMRQAFVAGEAAGRANLEDKLQEAIAQQAAAADAALDGARADSVALERRQAELQEMLDALEQNVAARRDASRACLASGVVRQLDALGRGPGSVDRGP